MIDNIDYPRDMIDYPTQCRLSYKKKYNKLTKLYTKLSVAIL